MKKYKKNKKLILKDRKKDTKIFDNFKKYFSISSCKNGYVYKILARNGCIGVFNSQDSSFTLSRFKFSFNYLFEEYHWDTGEPYGTVKPIEEIEECPKDMNDKDKLSYLNSLSKLYEKNIHKIIKENINNL